MTYSAVARMRAGGGVEWSVTSHPSYDFHVRDGITPIMARSTLRETAVVRGR
jgi:hypothetical protein